MAGRRSNPLLSSLLERPDDRDDVVEAFQGQRPNSSLSSLLEEHAARMDRDNVVEAFQPTPVITTDVYPKWCTIDYYEMRMKRGSFVADTDQYSITVNGFRPTDTEPWIQPPDRFCLSRLPNPERPSYVHEILQCIGEGVKLYNIDGDVFIESFSEQAVYVQSLAFNYLHGYHPRTVARLPKECNLTAFSLKEFVSRYTRASWNDAQTVYDLARMTTIRLSFGEGWGQDFHPRLLHTQMPCWIEINLDAPREQLRGLVWSWIRSIDTQTAPRVHLINRFILRVMLRRKRPKRLALRPSRYVEPEPSALFAELLELLNSA